LGCWCPKFSNFLTDFTIGLSWARFWRAFGISGWRGFWPPNHPVGTPLRHTLILSYNQRPDLPNSVDPSCLLITTCILSYECHTLCQCHHLWCDHRNKTCEQIQLKKLHVRSFLQSPVLPPSSVQTTYLAPDSRTLSPNVLISKRWKSFKSIQHNRRNYIKRVIPVHTTKA
jgi:hypothetical protein